MTRVIGFLAAAVLVAAAWAYLRREAVEAVIEGWFPMSEAVQDSSSPAPVPVTVEAARTADEPIYLSGIGTVQAFNTVKVKTQVDGKITQIMFTEGQNVKAGDPLIVIDPKPYDAILQERLAERARDAAALKGARLDLYRYTELVKTGASTQQQLDRQQAVVDQDEGSVLNDEAQIDYARTQLGFTTIVSPIDGKVGIRQVDCGNFVRASDGAVLVIITQLQPISAVFTISANSIARSHLGPGTAHIPVTALAEDDETKLDQGTIELVDNEVDQATGTLKLKATFPNVESKLWPGNFVNGRLLVDMRRDGLTVPTAAVRHGPRCDYVWLLRPDSTVVSKCVVTEQDFAGRVLIGQGLAVGSEVVVTGQFRLDEGSRVSVKARQGTLAPTKG